MKKQLKKTAAVLTAAAMLTAGSAMGAVTVSAAGGSIGSGGTMGVYTPSAGVITQQVMLAMPGSWTNQMTAQQGDVAGVYWWSGADNVSADFPGYKTTRVDEDGVYNLFSTQIPGYGNGESGDANLMVWNNYLDSGMEADPRENPYYAAAKLTNHFMCSFFSRYDKEERFETLFRYTYQKQAQRCGLSGAAALNISVETFWEDINRLAAAALGRTWSSLDENDKDCQIDAFFDEHNEQLDFSEYGSRYVGNFFNENFATEIYPKEEVLGQGISFTCDNMVYVVDLDAPVSVNPLNGHELCNGGLYFYYGGGQYGVMPTKALNTALGCEQGSFVTEKYLAPSQDGKITLSSVSLVNFDYMPDESKLNDEIRAHFAEDRVVIHPYNQIYEDATKISADETVLIDPMKMNYALYKSLPCKVVEAQNPTILMKAMKNPVEIENIRNAELKDSIALTKFIYWVKNNYDKTEITELSASDKLTSLRQEQEGYIRDSFEPLQAFGAHAAMMHYSPSPETDVVLKEGEMLLSDTGGGYYEGSTDITRTTVLGHIEPEMKKYYTAVFRAMQHLSTANFLYGNHP